MRIVDLREEWVDGWKRAVATIVWEQSKRLPHDLFFATPEASAHMLHPVPDAFLVAATNPAAYHFERRIAVEGGEVCPRLVLGLEEAMRILYRWYRDAPPIEIDVATCPPGQIARPDASAALMFSGGIDSLSILCLNREEFPLDHSESFRYGLVIGAGFDAFEMAPDSWYWKHLVRLAGAASLDLVAIRTNVRELEPADHYFGSHLFGALLSSPAHAMPQHVRSVTIASEGTGDAEEPKGSHRLIDPLYSSAAVEVRFDDRAPGRLERTAMVAEWPAAAENLRVCFVSNRLPEGQINCGRCEKCLRTMLSLLALGRLEEFSVFPQAPLTADFVREHLRISAASAYYYPEISEALVRAGRCDLADVVDGALASLPAGGTLRQRLRRIEREQLGGVVRRAKRKITHR